MGGIHKPVASNIEVLTSRMLFVVLGWTPSIHQFIQISTLVPDLCWRYRQAAVFNTRLNFTCSTALLDLDHQLWRGSVRCKSCMDSQRPVRTALRKGAPGTAYYSRTQKARLLRYQVCVLSCLGRTRAVCCYEILCLIGPRLIRVTMVSAAEMRLDLGGQCWPPPPPCREWPSPPLMTRDRIL